MRWETMQSQPAGKKSSRYTTLTTDRLIFQNNDLEPAQTVRYEDVIHVDTRRKLLGGRKLDIDVNRGRATVTLTLDFSGKPDAAEYVARFLQEALHRGAAHEMDTPLRDASQPANRSDIQAIERALEGLRSSGSLTAEDYNRIMGVVREL
jgi:hypothetical protein